MTALGISWSKRHTWTATDLTHFKETLREMIEEREGRVRRTLDGICDRLTESKMTCEFCLLLQ
jgi:hypothetical protein